MSTVQCLIDNLFKCTLPCTLQVLELLLRSNYSITVPCQKRTFVCGLDQGGLVRKIAKFSVVSYFCYNVIHNVNNLIVQIIENGITPSGFIRLDTEDFDDIGLTKFGKKLILKTLAEVHAPP